MYRGALYFLLGVLGALLAARMALPGAAAQEAPAPALSEEPLWGYQTGAFVPAEPETAGSGLVGEISRFFLSLPAAERHALTGSLEGRNLVLIFAGDWAADPSDRRTSPALYSFSRDAAQLTGMYFPEWYQAEGRSFALLTGLVPARAGDGDAMAWLASHGTYLPYTLANRLGGAGYRTLAVLPAGDAAEVMTALGFAEARVAAGTARDMVAQTADELSGEPFFAYYRLAEGEEDAALDLLLRTLEEAGAAGRTAVCLLTGDAEPGRGRLYLWGCGLTGTLDTPCSELDVTPTLLSLFGADYDSRFLMGRDILAQNAEPLVILQGSAYGSWLTDRGRYEAAESAFYPSDGLADGAYARAIGDKVYDAYVYSRRVLETDYFRAAERETDSRW